MKVERKISKKEIMKSLPEFPFVVEDKFGNLYIAGDGAWDGISVLCVATGDVRDNMYTITEMIDKINEGYFEVKNAVLTIED